MDRAIIFDVDGTLAETAQTHRRWNGLLSAHSADIWTIVTPGIHTQGETFAEAALVVDDLTSIDLDAIAAL